VLVLQNYHVFGSMLFKNLRHRLGVTFEDISQWSGRVQWAWYVCKWRCMGVACRLHRCLNVAVMQTVLLAAQLSSEMVSIQLHTSVLSHNISSVPLAALQSDSN